MRPRRSATLAACTVPWLAYGGVEILFSSLVPWLTRQSPDYWPSSIALTELNPELIRARSIPHSVRIPHALSTEYPLA